MLYFIFVTMILWINYPSINDISNVLLKKKTKYDSMLCRNIMKVSKKVIWAFWLCHPVFKVEKNSIVHALSSTSVHNVSLPVKRLPLFLVTLCIFSYFHHLLMFFNQLLWSMNFVILFQFLCIYLLPLPNLRTSFSKKISRNILYWWFLPLWFLFAWGHRKNSIKFLIFGFSSYFLLSLLMLFRNSLLELLFKHLC